MVGLPSATAPVDEHLEILAFGEEVLDSPHTELFQPVEDAIREHVLVSPWPNSHEVEFLQGFAVQDRLEIEVLHGLFKSGRDERTMGKLLRHKSNGVECETQLAEVGALHCQSEILIGGIRLAGPVREVEKTSSRMPEKTL